MDKNLPELQRPRRDRLTQSELARKVDQFGKLKAQISALCEREKEFKAFFIGLDKPEIDGKDFRVTISRSLRESLDQEMVRGMLTEDQLTTVTKVTSVTTVRCVSRTR